jgi:hypothetical protein
MLADACAVLARQAHYRRNEKGAFAGSNSERAVAKLSGRGMQGTARNKATADGAEV